MTTPQYRINHQIKAEQIRLLRDDNTQIGVMSLKDAHLQAQTAKLDLVEIAPQAQPPVVKLIDYKKFLYQLAKKAQAEKAASKKVDLKEIRLTPFMAENDLNNRLRQGKDFLLEGHKLRITVKFVGRQLTHKEFGDVIWNKAITQLAEVSQVDQAPKWVGKQYIGTLSAIKRK